MYNIPSNDPGVILVPGNIETFCEWLVTLNGGIATCVESSEMMVDHLVKSGFPVSAAEDISLTQDLQSRGQAGPSGATDWVAASEQMTRLGIPNDAYGQSWFAANDFVPVVQTAIRRGVPVLFGFYAALNAFDTWTNQPEDAGVYGHAIAIVGMDSTGAIVADPNTWQAKYGQFVHYTWADLKSAGGAWPSMIVPRGSYMLTSDPNFTIISDTDWECVYATKLPSQPAGSETKHHVTLGHLAAYRSWPAQGANAGVTAFGLPLSDQIFPDETKYPGVSVQFFQRGILVYDPNEKFFDPSGTRGQSIYAANLDDPRFASYLGIGSGVDADAGKDEATIAAMGATIAADNAKLAKIAADAGKVATDASVVQQDSK